MALNLISNAKENVNVIHRFGQAQNSRVFAGCEPSKSRADLDVNNVRCPIWINGDMWWDLTGTALYEVPVGSGKHSLLSHHGCGALAVWSEAKQSRSHGRQAKKSAHGCPAEPRFAS